MVHNRIEIDPAIRHGQPVIRGTRVPVARILSEVAAGVAFDRIATQYDVTQDDIRAAIAFAGELVADQAFVPVAPGTGNS